MIYIREDLRPLFSSERRVADFLRIDGEVFKEFPARRTLKFQRGGRDFFIKSHWGFGWKEIIRKLLSLHIPVIGAKTEWRAIRALEAISVSTMKIAAYGEEGINPATRRSFIVTEALNGTTSLEKWAPSFKQAEDTKEKIKLKRALIREVAQISRHLHANGINHRDFYLCHFLLDIPHGTAPSPENIKLYLIDLHRVQVRKRVPQRWIIKDIAGLFFSSMDLGLTARDMFRFMMIYSGKPLRVTLQSDRRFWMKVYYRALHLYDRQTGAQPDLPPIIYHR
ncbi:MAG: lipopolysaccharide core heptose(I) kinase RfaP [Gammaproteobacteria bacterium]|jgi:hypothetical protein|nr:lipopolysaccharide core heptose(I) kinase RfaP [Gammaproteobacteria bacterium]